MNKSPNKGLPTHLNKPNEINNYFSQYTSASRQVDVNLLHYYKHNNKVDLNERFSFFPVSLDEVKKCIADIKSTSTGSDGINIDMLLLCSPVILPYVTNIVNSCLLESQFPELWKLARIVPVPKNDNVSDLSELRPISILPCLSKVLEKIMCEQIRAFIDKGDSILPSHQSGFRPGYSCTTAMLDVVDDLVREADSGRATVLVSLDYTRAFDTINHDLLLGVLHFVGFSEAAVRLVASYISNRKQYVETSAGWSNESSVRCGVPQGSILGPLLFSIYTSNISSNLKRCKIHLYADDTQVYYSFFPDDWHLANKYINEDLSSLIAASEAHNLYINSKKSFVMLFGKHRRRLRQRLVVRVKDAPLLFTDHAKILGVVLDTDLRFKKHINQCIQRAYISLKILFPHRNILSQSLKRQLSDSLVLSHFNYCDVVYNPCIDKLDAVRIQRVQKSCLRFIFGIRKYDPVSYKLKEVKWLDMGDRRNCHSLVLFHKIILTGCPPYLANKIEYRTDVHHLNLRYKGLISPPQHRTSFFRRSFTFNIYRLYNEVPIMYKSLMTSAFGTYMKRYLLSGNA